MDDVAYLNFAFVLNKETTSFTSLRVEPAIPNYKPNLLFSEPPKLEKRRHLIFMGQEPDSNISEFWIGINYSNNEWMDDCREKRGNLNNNCIQIKFSPCKMSLMNQIVIFLFQVYFSSVTFISCNFFRCKFLKLLFMWSFLLCSFCILLLWSFSYHNYYNHK